jgi:signal transduction histidine kinase
MLHEFLKANHQVLVARCRAKVLKRTAPTASDAELLHGIPLFLGQLIKTLQVEETSNPSESEEVSGPAETRKAPELSEIGTSAAKHGAELLRHGFTVDEVVRDYCDLCQTVTELALEYDAPVTTDKLRTLNRCLDHAIAGAVTEFGSQPDKLVSIEGTAAMGKRLGALAHELRTLLDSTMLAITAVKRGHVGMAGATAAVLDRSLLGLRHVIDYSLADVRLAIGMSVHPERIDLATFVSEVRVAGQLEADARRCAFAVLPVEPRLAVDADRQMLSSAVANLVQNAFNCTRPGSHVSLRAYATADRVLIEVEDECGGLPQGKAEILFRPFEQGGADRTGLGLGLSIAQRSVEANGGVIRVRDLPGTGCVFTIDLPLPSDLLGSQQRRP